MRSACTLLALLTLPCVAGAEDVKIAPTAPEVRAVVQKSLPYLEKAAHAWMYEKRECTGCHHALTLWSFNEARAHGLAIDEKKLDGWTEWWLTYSHGRLSGPPGSWGWHWRNQKQLEADKVPKSVLQPLETFGTQWYVDREEFIAALKKDIPAEDWERYRDKILARAGRANGVSWRSPSQKKLEAKKVPAEVLAATKPLIDRSYWNREQFVDALKKSLPAETLHRYESDIVDAAQQPVDNDSMVFMLLGRAAARPRDRAALDKLAEPICRQQNNDGSWHPGLQFPSQNRPDLERFQVCTMWTVLALGSLDSVPESVAKSRDRALAWLKEPRPGISTESLFLSLLLARQQRRKEAAQDLLATLLKEQKKDGGWSWRRSHDQSDAMTTGQVLWVLSVVGDQPEAVVRGRRYLVTTQNLTGSGPKIEGKDLPYWRFMIQPAEGSWLMSSNPSISKKTPPSGLRDAFYQYWGTSWAVIGLLRTQPR